MHLKNGVRAPRAIIMLPLKKPWKREKLWGKVAGLGSKGRDEHQVPEARWRRFNYYITVPTTLIFAKHLRASAFL